MQNDSERSIIMPKRRVRGAKELVKYLDSIDCPMSESTIFKLMREKRIPHIRPSDRILLFDLDSIDKWIVDIEEWPTNFNAEIPFNFSERKGPSKIE